MVRLRILSKIQIKDSLRSNQVIKRSNLGQTWVKAVKLGSNRADRSKCTQYTYGSTPNFVQNLNSKFFEVKSSHQEVKLGSNWGQSRQIRVKSAQVVGIYPICMSFDSEFCQELEFVIIWCFWVKKSRLSVSVLHFKFVWF